MNLVIPMAGRGARFAGKGYHLPKPLISVAGRPIIAWALEGLGKILKSANVTFVVLQEHLDEFKLDELLPRLAGRAVHIVALPEVTQGQLCTVLAAREHFDFDTDLLVASSDTLVRSSIYEDIQVSGQRYDGIISVARLPGNSWSFARADDCGFVVEVAEKQRISDWASTGLYHFRDPKRFIKVAEEMVGNNERVRDEFYVIPVYQKLIAEGASIGLSYATEVADLGTPESAEKFQAALGG